MQNYTNIKASTTLTNSREQILNNDLTALSCSSGSAFPTAYPLVGMLCYRTDQNRLYQLKALPADRASNWHVIADLNQDYTNKAYVDANFALKSGDYSGLRARSTTKTDVGLSNIPNAITSSITDSSTAKLATAKAVQTLNGKIDGGLGRVATLETDITKRAATKGSTSVDFNANNFFAKTLIRCNGDIIASAGVAVSSDVRLKKNVERIENPLDLLRPISGVYYNLKKDNSAHVGLIAQHVAETIPHAIKEYDGHLALDYQGLIGVVISAVNELNGRLKRLEGINAAL